MAATTPSYTEAIRLLNGLQTPASMLEKVRKSRDAMNRVSIPEMRALVQSTIHGRLPPLIHIAGTKGKGSTAAFVDSILREKGYETGLFTSPHLVSVRERIRIRGRPISETAFAESAIGVHNSLRRSPNVKMPSYFRFLTLLAMDVFVKEKVQVAVIEVGMGGEYDCTNFIRDPKVTAITRIALDHTAILGNTVEKIAWHKAGIMKENVPCLTLSQGEPILRIFKERAVEKGASYLRILDPSSLGEVELGIKGIHQRENATLAIGIVNAFEDSSDLAKKDDGTLRGLRSASWSGRCQLTSVSDVEWCLDGAHTLESIQCCVRWYESLHRVSGPTALLFNVTTSSGNRQVEAMLAELRPIGFSHVIFSTNALSGHQDLKNLMTTHEKALTTRDDCAAAWGPKAIKVDNVNEGVALIKSLNCVRVLVCGSLHLVGSTMAVLDIEP